MPPKGKAPAVALPVEDALVELPEGLEVPDPAFRFVLAQLVSHVFCIEGEEKEEVEKEEGAEEVEALKELKDFDPLDSLAHFHEGDTPSSSSKVLLLARDELETFAEGGNLAHGLRRKAEAEKLCRRRKKVNEKRQKAIAEEEVEVEDDEIDFMVIVSGYPSTAEEVEELVDANLFELADAWVSIHLSGETLIDETDEEGATKRIAKMIGAPPAIIALREKVVNAEASTALAAAVVTELYNCHEWAPAKGKNLGAITLGLQ